MFPVDVSYGGSSNPPAAAVTNVGLQLGPRFQKFQGAQQTTGTHTHMRPASASSRLLSSASTASAVAPKTHADSQRGATKQNKPPFRPSSRKVASAPALIREAAFSPLPMSRYGHGAPPSAGLPPLEGGLLDRTWSSGDLNPLRPLSRVCAPSDSSDNDV